MSMMQMPNATGDHATLSGFRLHPDRRAETARRRRLLRDLAQAHANGAIGLHLRPRISLQTGLLVAAELRLRWAHRQAGLLRTDALFELAAQSGLAGSLAGWAMRQACSMAAHWPDEAVISVRIPPALHQPALLHLHVAEALETSGLAPERLELRFAEPDMAALSPDELLGLCAIRDLGVGVALEHFGSGATSLTTLRRLPISSLTLSERLLRHVPQDTEDAAILRAIIAVARALGLEIVADGVERAAQCALLTEAGCNAAQGRLFAPDGPQASLGQWASLQR